MKKKRNHKRIQIYCSAPRMIAFIEKYKREPQPMEIVDTFFNKMLK